MKDGICSLLIIYVIAQMFAALYARKCWVEDHFPRFKAARKNARSSNYGRAHKKLFNFILTGKGEKSSEQKI